MKPSGLRAIPSVDRVLQSLGDTGVPRIAVAALVRRELAALRKQKTVPSYEGVLSGIRTALDVFRAGRIQPVINGTGILVHTNFGRSPLGPAVIEALTKIGSQYNNLEFALAGGARGGRAAYSSTISRCSVRRKRRPWSTTTPPLSCSSFGIFARKPHRHFSATLEAARAPRSRPKTKSSSRAAS
jgi:hypothetical protein